MSGLSWQACSICGAATQLRIENEKPVCENCMLGLLAKETEEQGGHRSSLS